VNRLGHSTGLDPSGRSPKRLRAALHGDKPGILETPAAVAIQSAPTMVEIKATMAIMMHEDGIAEALESLLTEAARSIDIAVYRFNSARLAGALTAALERGIRIRLVLDRNKYEESASSRALFASSRIPFRVRYGRRGPGSKMHHKFAVIDGEVLATGSYNWTLESEEQNHENLLILRNSEQVKIYQREFEILWADSTPAH
jgi:phosphatidylserine/phosphatidylglycerophosphate/cardiolipin synthase-like enzyme